MRGKKDLFQLIHSLSKSEKRYFTIDAKKSGRKSSRYLELFQHINKQEEYEEAPLKQKFGRSLADDKIRLYEAILRSMRDYRSSKSYSAQIKEQLMDARFLYERGLYEQFEERIALAKEMAEELGDYLSILEINKDQRRLVKVRSSNKLEQQIIDLIEEKNTVEAYLRDEHLFLDLHDRLFLKISQYPQKLSKEQKENIEANFKENIQSALPFTVKSKIRFYLSRFYYYKLLDEQQKMYEAAENLVQCWDPYPKLKEDEYYFYMTHVANLLHAAFMNISVHKEKISQLLANLDAEVPQKFQSERQLFEAVALYQVLYHINTGDVQGIEQTVQKIEQGLDTYQVSPGRELAILFNTTLALFISQNFRACNYWILKIIDNSRLTNLRQDLLPITKILQVIVAFELNDINFFESYHRSAYRFFRAEKGDVMRGFDRSFLPSIKKAFYATTKEQKEELLNIKQGIESLEQPLPGGLDQLIALWIESKVNKKPIPKLIEESLIS